MSQIERPKQRSLIRIRHDEVEVDENWIRLNRTIVPVKDISGIRCNRYAFCVEIKTSDYIPIKIECKRFLRREIQALADLESIEAAIKRLLASKVALQIANHVFLGNNFDISTYSKFTHQGLWKTSAILPGVRPRSKHNQPIDTTQVLDSSYVTSLIPYDELEFRQSGNWLEIGPKGEPKFFYCQIDGNNWNSMIIEDIANNIVRLIREKNRLNRN
jgi:hypothetical protein